jgi:hypothetical protein
MSIRGALLVEISSSQLAKAPEALERALGDGVLGPGYSVRRSGQVVSFEGSKSVAGAPDRGVLTVHSDGRASYEAELRRAMTTRFGQAVLLACFVSVGTTVLLGWFVHKSLPAGFVAGLAWVIASIRRDRRIAHHALRTLLRSIPLLVTQHARS